jgi:hypothetical protein
MHIGFARFAATSVPTVRSARRAASASRASLAPNKSAGSPPTVSRFRRPQLTQVVAKSVSVAARPPGSGAPAKGPWVLPQRTAVNRPVRTMIATTCPTRAARALTVRADRAVRMWATASRACKPARGPSGESALAKSPKKRRIAAQSKRTTPTATAFPTAIVVVSDRAHKTAMTVANRLATLMRVTGVLVAQRKIPHKHAASRAATRSWKPAPHREIGSVACATSSAPTVRAAVHVNPGPRAVRRVARP